MRFIRSKFLTLEQKQSLFELWNLEYPERICYNEIGEFENYLKGLSNQKHYLLIDNEDAILGWAFTFNRDEDSWFAIILNCKIHRKRYGIFLLQELKKNNLVLNGWATDHQQDLKRNKDSYFSPIEFYIKNGFLVHPNIRIENDKISAVKIRWEKS